MAGLISLSVTGIHAQSASDSTGTSVPLSGSTIRFRQKFNTYNWQAALHSERTVNRRWTLSFSERFHSSLLALGTSGDKWKDDQHLLFNIGYALRPWLNIQSRLSSLFFRDNQSGFNNDIRTQFGDAGVALQPHKSIRGSFRIGPKWDARFQQHDAGTSIALDFAADHLNWEEYDHNLQLAWDRDQFERRRNDDLSAHYRVAREFITGTADSLHAYTTRRRVDNYSSILGDIESLRENIRGLDNVLIYTLSKKVRLDLRTGLQLKNVEVLSYSDEVQSKRRRRNDQSLSNELIFRFKGRGASSLLNFSYWSMQQRYDIDVGETGLPFSRRTGFVTPDNERSRLSLFSRTGVRASRSDSLFAYFSVSRFQYDTPDTSNYDDRDELRINTRFKALHRFNRYLSAELVASVNLYHMVYIFGERSADNNWNRIFLLRPALEFSPFPALEIDQAFEVLANYVDYDFEKPEVSTRSYLFRKFAVDDTLRWNLSPHSALTLDFRLQLEENGQLSWEAWTERILLSRRSHWLHFLWSYDLGESLRLVPGITLYSRQEWRHQSDAFGVERRTDAGAYLSYGPILRLSLAPSARLRLIFEGIRYAVHPANKRNYYVNNLELLLQWRF